MKRLALGLVLVASLAPRSARADAAECIAANERAIKERQSLALRAAQTDYRICAETTCPSEIASECARQLHDITLAIPSIVFVAKDAAGNDLTEVKVEMDGQLLATSLDARAVPIDPGEHTFVLTTPGHPSVTKHVLVREGEKDRRERVAFGELVAPITATKHDPTWRVMGATIASVGLAGIVLGSIFGGLALSAQSDQNRFCDPNAPTCTGVARTDALAALDRAYTFAGASTAAFIAGPALLVLGGVLFFAAPVVRSDGASVAIRGTF